MAKTPPIVLTIAGSDSGGGAGIQADLKTFAAMEVYGVSVITAVTAQNTLGVTAMQELPVSLIKAQIDAIAADLAPRAVKTGMLSSADVIEAVAAKLREHRMTRLVVDPVMVAQGGARLIRDDAIQVLTERLVPRALVVTPNAPEAEALAGMPVRNVAEARAAAIRIHSLGPEYVLIKGGHFEEDATDTLFDGQRYYSFTSERIATTNTHGTGCTLSSAIASGIASGMEVVEAVSQAKEYVTGSLRQAFPVGSGHGPLNHFHRWWGSGE